MILITGAAGFIGSYLVGFLNSQGREDLILADDFSRADKSGNLKNKRFSDAIEREHLFEYLKSKRPKLEMIFHLGARTDTTEKDVTIFNHLNLEYSKQIWNYCTQHQIPLVYASSAATYGLGEWGFDDADYVSQKLRPLNPYGDSKQQFDLWVLGRTEHPPFWAGLKFFNVYGPNEYHKGRMASVPFHIFQTLNSGKQVKLFRSHKSGIADGEQQRDFIYVKDLAKVCWFLYQHSTHSGIYNLGTGKARTFLDLARACFTALNKEPQISFIDTPEDIRETYQYFTEAKMEKLKQIGYTEKFTELEEGISDYYQNYLSVGNYF